VDEVGRFCRNLQTHCRAEDHSRHMGAQCVHHGPLPVGD
jgi:hypothetical protein